MIRPSVLWALSVIVALALAVTLNRYPIEYGDGPFYASISRSLAHGFAGVPSVLKEGPTAVDHVRFYGPVFFSSLAAWFSLVGLSSLTFRLFCFATALLVTSGAVAVSWSLGGGAHRQAWSFLILLLSPELGFAATFGRMDALAVGLEMFALALFVHGLLHQRRPYLHGIASGTVLAGAALTTPRTFPFVLGFAVAILVVLGRRKRSNRHNVIQTSACLGVATLLWLAWTLLAAGGPVKWLWMMFFIATHENTDVALLGTPRQWIFSPWQLITPAFSIAGAFLLAPRLRGDGPQTIAAKFSLAVTWVTFVVTWTLFSYTLLFGTYAILPLFAVVLAVPLRMEEINRRRVAMVGLALLVAFGGLRVVKLARAAVTWSGRNPDPLTAFVREHVPPGSDVVGYEHDYFFSVEESGSRYLIASQVSGADWARWMDIIDRRAPTRVRALRADYLIWPNGEDGAPLPPSLTACLTPTRIAIYDPPPVDLPRLERLTRGDGHDRYPSTALYRLTPRCGDDAMTR